MYTRLTLHKIRLNPIRNGVKRMTIEDNLLQRFGPLLSLVQLATILDRSPDGLRISLRSRTPWTTHINRARLKIGRRVYFRTSQIAEALSADSLECLEG